MKNYGLQRFKTSTVENFTTDYGMEIRKKMNPFLRNFIKAYSKMSKHEVIVDNYPELEDDTPYIFVSTHYYADDSTAALATLDRNAYMLFGTTNQLEVNQDMYVAWANGFIYVDREEPKSRKDAVKKMERVLDNGNSVLLFPEGGFNNTDNLLCQKLFASPYILAQMTGAKVVPIAPYEELETGDCHVNVGEPLDLASYEDKKEALRDLRDSMATLVYENLENHAPKLVRNEMTGDGRLDYMEERKNEYLRVKWTRDVWDEELTRYLDAEDKEYKAVQESMQDIKITKDNAAIMAPILARQEAEQKYDFNRYMHENWQKPTQKVKTR